MACEHCNSPSKENDAKECCWSRALGIWRFKRRVWNKFILGSIFDMVISVTSVSTDIIAIATYFAKGKTGFAILTMIPVLLPTFVFTNVYLTDESNKKSKPKYKVASISRNYTSQQEGTEETSMNENRRFSELDSSSFRETVESSSTDSSIMEENKANQCRNNCWFHFSCCSRTVFFIRSCCGGFMQCFCHRDHKLRRKGAMAVKNSLQKMFKYCFGTFVLRFIAWAWYIKALIFGIKAHKEPKRYMKMETPDNHWSYELLIRLDFLQAALENAPQCCIQLYALITQPDEDVALGLLTLAFSFIDFIRISVSVHWDMNKGPVTAPTGCYDTWAWKLINTLSWIFIYSARAAALALIIATSGYNNPKTIFPATVLLIHVLIFSKLLSKAEYGVAAQKIVVATFISLFFLPELDSSVMPVIIQFYYAMILFQNAFFIVPWDGFEKEYCVTKGDFQDRGSTRPPFSTGLPTSDWITEDNKITPPPHKGSSGARNFEITHAPPVTEQYDHGECLIDPTIITLAVPTVTMLGVLFRLIASQKMVHYKRALPCAIQERDMVQNKLESSIANIFNRKWTQMSVNEMLSAFFRMLKKEVVISDSNPEDKEDIEAGTTLRNKKLSFMSSRLQADFLASQTFIRESFSLLTRTTRSHDINVGSLIEARLSEERDEETPPAYNSDSELTLRLSNNLKRRPRLPMSRNVSESTDVNVNEMKVVSSRDPSMVQVNLPTGSQFLEMCWV